MAILDSILGIDEIEEQEERANRVARERFNPDQFLPQLRESQRQAEEGIVDDPLREQFLSQTLGQDNLNQSDLGISSGRFLAQMNRANQAEQETIGQFETRIGLEEERAKREGRASAAEIMGQRKQVEAQREAQIARNRVMAEAEADRRRKQFGNKMGKLTGIAAGSVLGPAGAAIAGGVGGRIFGGSGQAALSGAISGGLSAANLGEEKTEQTEGVSAEQINTANIFGNLGEEDTLDFAEGLMQTPTAQEEEQGQITLSDILNL